MYVVHTLYTICSSSFLVCVCSCAARFMYASPCTWSSSSRYSLMYRGTIEHYFHVRNVLHHTMGLIKKCLSFGPKVYCGQFIGVEFQCNSGHPNLTPLPSRTHPSPHWVLFVYSVPPRKPGDVRIWMKYPLNLNSCLHPSKRRLSDYILVFVYDMLPGNSEVCFKFIIHWVLFLSSLQRNSNLIIILNRLNAYLTNM